MIKCGGLRRIGFGRNNPPLEKVESNPILGNPSFSKMNRKLKICVFKCEILAPPFLKVDWIYLSERLFFFLWIIYKMPKMTRQRQRQRQRQGGAKMTMKLQRGRSRGRSRARGRSRQRQRSLQRQ